MNDFETIIKAKSDEELTDIFINPSDYQIEFIELVQQELVNRKIPIEALLKLQKEQSKIDDEVLEMGEQGSQFWIVFAFIASIFWGIYGIFAGYNYAYSKRKTKNGKEYYVYNESTRKYGKWMLIVSSTILGLALYLRFFLL